MASEEERKKIQEAEARIKMLNAQHVMTKQKEEIAKKKKEKASGGFFSFLGPKEDEFEIAGPTGFKQTGHIGYDPNKGYDIGELPPQFQAIIKKAGVTDEQLKDPQTAQFVIEFIEKQLATVARAREGGAPPTTTPTAAAPSPNNYPRPTTLPPTRPPPPRPGAGGKEKESSSSASSVASPRSKERSRDKEKDKDSRDRGRDKDKKPSKPDAGAAAAAAAPPPPPPPPAPAPPPPPPAGGEPKSPKTPKSPKAAPPAAPGKSDLLGSIQKGIQLKPVDTAAAQQSKISAQDEDSIAGALQRALMNRRVAIRDDDDEEEENNGEWD